MGGWPYSISSEEEIVYPVVGRILFIQLLGGVIQFSRWVVIQFSRWVQFV